MKTPLGTEVDLGAGHIVLDGFPLHAALRERGTAPRSFRPMSTVATVAHLSYCWALVVLYLRQGGYVFVVVCLFVSLLAALRKNVRTDLHEIFREGWQLASEQIVKFWWRFGSSSGYRDWFPDSSLLGDTESGINQPRYAMLHRKACTSRYRHSNYMMPLRNRPTTGARDDIATLVRHALADVCTVPVLLVSTFYCVWEP